VQNYNLKGKNLRNITTYKKKISALAWKEIEKYL
jgi:hypothetical protein